MTTRPTYPITSSQSFEKALELAGVKQGAVTITAPTFTIPNDPSDFYRMDSGTNQVVTLVAGMTKWKPGTVINMVQLGLGTVSIIADPGVTIRNQMGVIDRISKGRYSVIQLLNIGSDTWIALAGGLD